MNSNKISGLSVAALILAVFITYWGVLDNGFVAWDDKNYLLDNPSVQSLSIDSLREIFLSFRNGNYHPLPLLSYALEYQIYSFSPAGYHAVSLAWHAANVVLVFLLLKALGLNAGAAFVASLFYAVHPLRVEAVAWVTGRKDLMCTFFSLGALLVYISWARLGRRRDYWLVLGFLLLALLSKGTAIVLPPLLLIVDRLLGREFDRQAIVEKLPHALLVLCFSVVAFMARDSFQGVLEESNFGLPAMLAIGVYRLVFYYLARTVLPLPHLLPPYPSATTLFDPWVIAALLVFVILGVVLCYKRWCFSRGAMGGWFFLVAILPALFLPVVGYSADRFAYFPSIGLAFCAGCGFEKVTQLWNNRLFEVAGLGSLVALAGLLAWAAAQRCEIWRDSVALYSDSIALFERRKGHEPNLSRAHTDRGNAYREGGNRAAAFADYTRAVQIDPEAYRPWLMLGDLQLGNRQLPEAVDSFSRAIDVAPERAAPWMGRSMAFRQLGELPQALSDAEQAVMLSPSDAVAYNTRGTVWSEMGRLDEALRDFNRVVELSPRRIEGYLNRGAVFDRLGQLDRASRDFYQVLQLEPDNRTARGWIAARRDPVSQ